MAIRGRAIDVRALALLCLVWASSARSIRAQSMQDLTHDLFVVQVRNGCALGEPDVVEMYQAEALRESRTTSIKALRLNEEKFGALVDSVKRAGGCDGIPKATLDSLRTAYLTRADSMMRNAPLQAPLQLRWGMSPEDVRRVLGDSLRFVDFPGGVGKLGRFPFRMATEDAVAALDFDPLLGLVSVMISIELDSQSRCEAVANRLRDGVMERYPTVKPVVTRVNQSTALSLCDAVRIGRGGYMIRWSVDRTPSSIGIFTVPAGEVTLRYESGYGSRAERIRERAKAKSVF